MARHPVRTPQQLALVLQGYRRQAGLTQKEAATKVGMLPKTISLIENDADSSSIASLFKLLSALDLEIVLQAKGSSTATPDGDEW
ncbi:Xre family transcriptional regulator [Methylovorus glucosotrophus]|uniref:helix-turn-helix domain-containing protein n=1 Tax=Methylovorus glucosotrophus TaxID=266009 RepID=UPI0013319D04|nr:helix-turn-helix domain-containing protein [Methylovorus glucosotrophus]KAF0844397.1 Xre family transcriptional regulator [Methylovorus glucosotrophus]